MEELIVFAKTRHTYDSYTDFWRLVEASGFPMCFLDEMDLSLPITYVVTPWNGETIPAVRAAQARGSRGKVVWWCLERDIADNGVNETYTRDLALFDNIWVSDRSYARIHPKFRHVVLAGSANFGTRCVAKVYDVCALAYLWGRRKQVIDVLTHTYGFTIAPEAFGREAQDRHVATSRLMLNMHQYTTAKIAAPLRFAVAASYHLPLITEELTDAWPLGENTHYVSASLGALPDLVRAVLHDPDRLDQLAINLHAELVLKRNFATEVKNAVEQLWQEHP